jgi:hypothetical protein
MAEVTPGTPAPSMFVHRPGDAWDADAELHVAADLVLELHPAGGYRWSPITSSDESVATASGTVDDAGVARYTVVGKTAGTAELSASTQHLGDRFGPQTRRWTMRLRVLEQPHMGY